uniref:C3H1-type domain-containing protein n=1 Tax=Globodera pallida TaxID=36090 RepID=A0A183CJA2_GLOPA
MIRLPSEPSPFATVQCPFNTRANCRRPYCPFAHRIAAVNVEDHNAAGAAAVTAPVVTAAAGMSENALVADLHQQQVAAVLW